MRRKLFVYASKVCHKNSNELPFLWSLCFSNKNMWARQKAIIFYRLLASTIRNYRQHTFVARTFKTLFLSFWISFLSWQIRKRNRLSRGFTTPQNSEYCYGYHTHILDMLFHYHTLILFCFGGKENYFGKWNVWQTPK